MKQKIYRQQYNDLGLTGSNIFNFIALRYKELNVNEAVRVFRLGLHYYPKDYNMICNLAGIYIERNDSAEALVLLQSAKTIEDEMVELDISEETNEVKSGFDLVNYENFSQDKFREVSTKLIQEIQKYYKVTVDNSHIFFYMGNIYYRLNLNFLALICCMREIKLNKSDQSGFASFSKAMMPLIVSKLTDFEKQNIISLASDRITENLAKFKKQLNIEKFESKKMYFIQAVFAFHELICEYLYRNYSIKLDEKFPFSLTLLSSNDLFKVSTYPKILEVLKLDYSIVKIYDRVTEKDILDILSFYENFVDYNLPLITIPNKTLDN